MTERIMEFNYDSLGQVMLEDIIMNLSEGGKLQFVRRSLITADWEGNVYATRLERDNRQGRTFGPT